MNQEPKKSFKVESEIISGVHKYKVTVRTEVGNTINIKMHYLDKFPKQEVLDAIN